MTDLSKKKQECNISEQTNSSDENDDENQLDDNQNYDGYCLISTNENLNKIDEDEDPDEAFVRFASDRVESLQNPSKNVSLPNQTTIDSIWTGKVENQQFSIDDEKAEQIKTMMSKVEFPKNNVPQWAQICSEEDWQKMLRERIACRQRTFFPDDEK